MRLKPFIAAIVLLAAVVYVPAQQVSQENAQVVEYIKRYLNADQLDPHMIHGFAGQAARLHYRDSIAAVTGQGLRVEAYTEPSRQFFHLSPSGHFRLHYDITGSHAVDQDDLDNNGIPDFIDTAAVVFDHVWDIEINQLGFQRPLDEDGNPVNTYDVYFSDLSSGLYGLTVFKTGSDGLPADVSTRPGTQFSTYIEMDHNFRSSGLYTRGLDALLVTAAHEFNHALQLGYRVDLQEDFFFYEATSTWLEEYVYDHINDYYQYLPGLFNGLQSVPFTTSSFPYPYAHGLFCNMIASQYGPEIVSGFWRRIEDESAVDAINSVLQNRGSSFSEAHNDYGRWLYFTGKRAIDGFFFPEAAQYPELTVFNRNKYDVFGPLDLTTDVGRLSYTFLALNDVLPFRQQARARVENGQVSGRYSHFSINDFQRPSVPLGNAQIIDPVVPDTVTLLISNADDFPQTVFFTMQPDTIAPSSIGPNPVNISRGQEKAYFYNIPADATISVYNMNGRPLRVLQNGGAARSQIAWDLRDYNGELLSSGIYIYVIQGGGTQKQGKFAVIR